jgi:hypothetical protein
MRTVPDVDELDAELASRLRATLDERGMRREDLARGMVGLGFRWTGNTVTQVVTGRRGLSLLELAGVCEILSLPIGKLLDPNAHVVLPSGDEALVADLLLALLYESGGRWAESLGVKAQVKDAQAEVQRLMGALNEEATFTAAQRLGVMPSDVDDAAQRLWGHSFTTERDNRVGDPTDEGDTANSRRALQARRGHASRAMIEELRAHFPEQQS